MPAWLLPATIGAVGAISAARTKAPRFDAKAARRINDRFWGARPTGYLTEADKAQSERRRTRGVASARRSGQLAREGAQLQSSARRLSGASAAALQTEANQVEAIGRESAFAGAADLEDILFNRNRDIETEKLFKSWGAELGAAAGDAQRGAQEEAGLWNSILSAAPLISSSWGAIPTTPAPGVVAPATTGGAATYNPSAGLPRRSAPMY